MLKSKDTMGLQIITLDAGAKLGKVHDLLLDGAGTKVLGLLVDEGGWFSSAKVVPWTAIRVIGADAVIVDSEMSQAKASDIPEMKQAVDRGASVHGLHIHTTEGRDLGKIDSFYYNAGTGKVDGFGLSGSLGNVFLPAPASLEIGKDVAFVEPSAAETVQDLKKSTK